MRLALWLALPWYLKLAVLVALALPRRIGKNEIVDGIWISERGIEGSDE